MFSVYVVPKTCKTDDAVKSFIKDNDLCTVDICSYLGKFGNYRGLYFDPTKYPPEPFIKGQKSTSFDQLKRDFALASSQNGSLMVANGPSKKDAQDRLFTCQVLYRQRKKNKEIQAKKRESGGYRSNRLIYDKKENRKNGKSLPRRRAKETSKKARYYNSLDMRANRK